MKNIHQDDVDDNKVIIIKKNHVYQLYSDSQVFTLHTSITYHQILLLVMICWMVSKAFTYYIIHLLWWHWCDSYKDGYVMLHGFMSEVYKHNVSLDILICRTRCQIISIYPQIPIICGCEYEILPLNIRFLCKLSIDFHGYKINNQSLLKLNSSLTSLNLILCIVSSWRVGRRPTCSWKNELNSPSLVQNIAFAFHLSVLNKISMINKIKEFCYLLFLFLMFRLLLNAVLIIQLISASRTDKNTKVLLQPYSPYNTKINIFYRFY